MRQLRESMLHGRGVRTSCHAMDFMLYEEVNHRNDSSEKGGGDVFPIFDCLRIRRAQGEAAGRPGNGSY